MKRAGVTQGKTSPQSKITAVIFDSESYAPLNPRRARFSYAPERFSRM